MKTGLRLLSILLLIVTTFNTINAQSNEKLSKKEAKVIEEQADINYEDKNYLDALDQFTQLYNYKPDDLYYKLMMGICMTYDPIQKAKSIDIIEQVKLVNPEYNLVNFYLGRAYAVNYEFDKATGFFNTFLSRATNEDEDQKLLSLQMIENCRNAKEILADTIVENVVENLSNKVNSEFGEYVPVISADESVMIYTYRGDKSVGADDVKGAVGSDRYKEDVFITYKKDGEWTEPKSIGENINTKEHDAAIALSVDGQTLFIYKTDGGGDIYVSYLSGEDWSRPRPVKGEVNKKDSWEGSCSLAADGKTLYFASDRDGGLGGRDIYKAELLEDETWGNVQNLGSNINTVYNDDAPFMHPDDKTLYFSSQGHTSVGGYDVFSSTKDENGIFGTPVNLGYPINTIDDNRYFVLAANGKTGYYSADGKTSKGGQDIYKITTGKIGKPVMALLKGIVYFDDTPTSAKLIMYENSENDIEGSFNSNSETGKYTMALSVGTHKVKVQLETGEVLVDSVSLDKIEGYVVLEKDFKFYSDKDAIVQNDPTLEDILNAELGIKPVDTVVKEDLTTGKVFALNGIEYDFDKSTLRSVSKKELDNLVAILKENKGVKVEISSHTDASRNVAMATSILKRKGLEYSKTAHDEMSKKYNARLSQRRANSVVNYLINKGISKSRLVAKGYGEESPIATNDTDAGKQKNRRTEFKILEGKK
ncbi:MAG: OmpA family protein [Vicingaceae bacterium]|nr:OmpA family protein [Vicingaceae bacterium]